MSVVAVESELLTPAETAEYLRVAPRTLPYWRWNRQGPPFVKVGFRVRYKRSDLDEFIRRGTRGEFPEDTEK